jgi:hypothetical protein
MSAVQTAPSLSYAHLLASDVRILAKSRKAKACSEGIERVEEQNPSQIFASPLFTQM